MPDNLEGLTEFETWAKSRYIHPADEVKLVASNNNQPVSNICVMDLKVITMQIYENSGVCCEYCRKLRDNDIGPTRMTVDTQDYGRG